MMFSRLSIIAATLVAVLQPSTALAGIVFFDNGGSMWIAVTWDDAELFGFANGSETLLCEGDGWAAKAQENPAEGGVSGFVCGYGSRSAAEAAAIETCPGSCQMMWSGYDDDVSVRNIDNGHTALQDRTFY